MTKSLTNIQNLKPSLANAFVFIWFLSLSLYFSLQRIFPYIYDDEYGVLGAAAVFSGLDWVTPDLTPFYGFLLSLITFPFYWLDLESTSLYRATLAVNALLVAITAYLAIKSIRLLFRNQSEIDRIIIIIAAFSYPAVLHYSAIAMAETTLLFCFILIVYHLTALVSLDRPKMFHAIFLGLGIGLAQFAHSRGIAFVYAGILIVLFSMRRQSIKGKFLVAISVSATLTIALLAYLKSYLLATFYSHEQVSTSVTSFLGKRLELLNSTEIVNFVLTGFGQLSYLMTSTFGLLVSGISILTLISWRYLLFSKWDSKIGQNQSNYDAIGLLSGYVLLSSLIMFAASVLAVFRSQRTDHIFYGRYNEVVIPALIVAALVFLTHLPTKVAWRWVLTGFIVAVLSLLLINLYPASSFEKTTYLTPISSWAVSVVGPWKIDPRILLLTYVMAFSVLIVSMAISRKLIILVLIAFYSSTFFFCFEQLHEGADRSWEEFSLLSKKLESDLNGMNLQATGGDFTTKLKGEALQFAFPRAHVRYGDADLQYADAVLDYNGDHCQGKVIAARVTNGILCFVSERLNSTANFKPVVLAQDSLDQDPADGVKIELSEKLKSTGLKLGNIDRLCQLISMGYYTRWARYCLPPIEIQLTQEGASDHEYRNLGLFITDSENNWLYEWRVEFDNDKLAQGKTLQMTLRPELPISGIPPGTYWLNIATVGNSGWNYSSIQTVELSVK